MKLFFVVLFFCLFSRANDCVNRALASAQKAEGGAAGAVNTATANSINGAAGAVPGGKVAVGMETAGGRKLNELSAGEANRRADIYKAATGKNLTPDQAIALLDDVAGKKILTNSGVAESDYAKYLNEKANPGAGAKAAAAEAAEEARKQAEAQTRAEAQRVADEKRKQEQRDAIARSEERRANEFLGGKKDAPVFNTSVDNMTAGQSRLALEANAPSNALAAARAVVGLESVMSEFASKIPKLQAALAASIKNDSVSKSLDKGAEGLRTKELKRNLEKAISECSGLITMAAKAGLNATSIRDKVSDFVSSTCR